MEKYNIGLTEEGIPFCVRCGSTIDIDDILDASGSIVEGYTETCIGICHCCNQESTLLLTSKPGAITLKVI